MDWRALQYWCMYNDYFHLKASHPASSIHSRRSLDQVNYFSYLSFGEDLDLESKLRSNNISIIQEKVDLDKIYYLYRWTTQISHVSAYGDAGYDKFGEIKVDTGYFTLKPNYSFDYLKLTRTTC